MKDALAINFALWGLDFLSHIPNNKAIIGKDFAMARWKLTEPHYLHVPGTTWEYAENDRITGRPKRTVYNVPAHLDPRIETDWNYRTSPMDGDIIVCWEGRGEPKDIVFIGNPTPGMLPLDDEAKQISSQFTWTPTAGIDDASQANSFQMKLVNGLIEEIAKANAGVAETQQSKGFDEFMKVMAAMMQQQTQILAAIAGKQTVETPVAEGSQQDQQAEFERIANDLGLEPIADDLDPLPAPPKNPRRRT